MRGGRLGLLGLILLAGCGGGGDGGDDGGGMDAARDGAADTVVVNPDGARAEAGDVGADAYNGPCRNNLDCSDGVFCDGEERCMPGATGANAHGCLPPASSTPCTTGQTCNEAMDRCETMCDRNPDADGDSHRAVSCGGDDCDDGDPMVYPGHAELCDSVGRDEDCDPRTYGGPTDGDRDHDGYISANCCNRQASGSLSCGDDCNDDSITTNPAASEICNTRDDNCNGQIDEGVTRTFYRDMDGDNYGSTASGPTMMGCMGMNGYVENSLDCDDAHVNVNPAQTEVCDGLDNNCNGATDEGLVMVFYQDQDADGHGATNGATMMACQAPAGYVSLRGDCNDSNPAIYVNAPEACDGLDNNCNGQTDEGLATISCYRDTDGDGIPAAGAAAMFFCNPSCPQGYVTRVSPTAPGDCNDGNALVFPGQSSYYGTAISGAPVGTAYDYDCSMSNDIGFLTDTSSGTVYRNLVASCSGLTQTECGVDIQVNSLVCGTGSYAYNCYWNGTTCYRNQTVSYNYVISCR